MTASSATPARSVPTLWRILVGCYAVLFAVLAITGTLLVFAAATGGRGAAP